MKKLIIFAIFLIIPVFSYCEDKITVTVFYSTHCRACLKTKEEILPPIIAKYKDKVEWKVLETSHDEANLSYLMSLAARFGRGQSRVPSVLAGDSFMVGYKEIETGIDKAIDEAFEKKGATFNIGKMDLVQVFQKISVYTIMGSGLIDGVNPCAFAVIVFFISFLAVYGYRRREIIWVGIFYCLAVFITYLLLGLGFFQFLYAMSAFYALIKSFYYVIAGFCFLLAALAINDYLTFRRSGESNEMILQLPKFLKKKINLTIGSHLREGKQRGVLSLAFSSFIVGFLVSLLEAVCTGQVYVPTIVFILKNTALRLKAFGYLLLYNFMFIVPLIVVFVLSLMGFGSQWFNNFLKKNVGRIKIVMAVLFLVLGAVILLIS